MHSPHIAVNTEGFPVYAWTYQEKCAHLLSLSSDAQKEVSTITGIHKGSENIFAIQILIYIYIYLYVYMAGTFRDHVNNILVYT